MGKTLVQKILSEKVGHAVTPGDAVVLDVDFIGLHDGSGPLAVRLMQEKSWEKIFNPKKVILKVCQVEKHKHFH